MYHYFERFIQKVFEDISYTEDNMSSFVISKLKLDDKKVNAKDFSERLFSLPSDLSIVSIKPLIDKNYLILEIAESVSLKFSYLDNPLQVSLKTKIIISFEGLGLMVSSSNGIGIITKGGAKKYIDTYIGRVIARTMFDDESAYIPFTFSNKQMNPAKWGEDLRYLKVSLPDIGSGTITGKGFTSKIKDMDHLFGNIEQDKIIAFKMSSKILKRTVNISSNGIIKVQNKDILPVFEYIQHSLK